MIDEDLLNRLPDAGYPTTTRPIPRIVTRAHEIRRGKRRFAAGAIAGVATLVTGVSVVSGGLPLPGRPGGFGHGPAAQSAPSVVRPTDARTPLEGAVEGSECGSTFLAPERLTTVADLVYLPSLGSTGPITGPVQGAKDTAACPFQPPQAVAYSMTNGSVSHRVSIGAPDARNEYGTIGQNGSSYEGQLTHVDIDGTQAAIYGMPGFSPSRLYMFWTAPDGSSRELKSEGLTSEQLSTVARSLTFAKGGTLDQSSTPPGLASWANLPPMPSRADAAKISRSFSIGYNGDTMTSGFEFDVKDRPSYLDAPFGGQLVTIDLPAGKVQGWWKPQDDSNGVKALPASLIWQADGLEFEVIAYNSPLTRDQALAVATSTVKTGPENTRLLAASR